MTTQTVGVSYKFKNVFKTLNIYTNYHSLNKIQDQNTHSIYTNDKPQKDVFPSKTALHCLFRETHHSVVSCYPTIAITIHLSQINYVCINSIIFYSILPYPPILFSYSILFLSFPFLLPFPTPPNLTHISIPLIFHSTSTYPIPSPANPHNVFLPCAAAIVIEKRNNHKQNNELKIITTTNNNINKI